MNPEHLSLFWLFWAEKILIFIDNIDNFDFICPSENTLL